MGSARGCPDVSLGREEALIARTQIGTPGCWGGCVEIKLRLLYVVQKLYQLSHTASVNASLHVYAHAIYTLVEIYVIHTHINVHMSNS